MDGFLLLLLLVAAYAVAAYYVHNRKIREDHITFYGPFMALKTSRVDLFDRFFRFRTFLQWYGTLGSIMVIIVSAAMVGMLGFSLYINIVHQPPPTAANEFRNILAIPGVNDFIPFTVAVWLGIIVTMIVHEFGHGVLARIEGMRVRAMGVLLLVIPVGAFVEPDEEDLYNTRGLPKIRMLGAGITNNIVAGLACFILLVLLLGMAVPLQAPLIKAVYVDYPAARADIPPDSLIMSIDGTTVSSRDEISAILNSRQSGDRVTIVVKKEGVQSAYTFALGEWPKTIGRHTGGFMGVSYYNSDQMKEVFNQLASPAGVLILLGIPIWVILDPGTWGYFLLLLNDSTDTLMWSVPFPHFWPVVQLLFWCAWFNLVVGTFNALPMIPLDGGYILKEGVDRFLDRRGLFRYSGHIIAAVSYVMLIVIVSIFLMPRLFHMG